ncbi:MAG: hypothetical protein ACI944_002856, partial [Natronomonas sp.]
AADIESGLERARDTMASDEPAARLDALRSF